MSLMRSFIVSCLIPALEAAFHDCEPELHEAFLIEVKEMAMQMVNWVESKVEKNTTI